MEFIHVTKEVLKKLCYGPILYIDSRRSSSNGYSVDRLQKVKLTFGKGNITDEKQLLSIVILDGYSYKYGHKYEEGDTIWIYSDVLVIQKELVEYFLDVYDLFSYQ